MYITSTNIAEYHVNVYPKWYTSEKFYNCEDLYSSPKQLRKRGKLFGKREANKNN